jgi:hypothetical protein
LTPSKLNADPYRPDAVHAGPDSDPLFPPPDESTAVAPDPASNPYAATRPAGAALCAMDAVYVVGDAGVAIE